MRRPNAIVVAVSMVRVIGFDLNIFIWPDKTNILEKWR